MADWSYSEESRRYRDNRTGRYLSAASERAIRDDYIGRKQADIATAAGKVASGEQSVARWEREMQRHIRDLHANEYAFGKGGRKQVTEREGQQITTVVAEQERYLAEFAAAIARGELTPAQTAARSNLYAEAARSSYHRGKAATYDGLILPAMPADGGTICLVNCRCEWVITETETEWEATWTLDGGEHCVGCVARSQRWAPLIQAKPVRTGVAA